MHFVDLSTPFMSLIVLLTTLHCGYYVEDDYMDTNDLAKYYPLVYALHTLLVSTNGP